jgi:hypothetical protein
MYVFTDIDCEFGEVRRIKLEASEQAMSHCNCNAQGQQNDI